jgi:hypothetical protein
MPPAPQSSRVPSPLPTVTPTSATPLPVMTPIPVSTLTPPPPHTIAAFPPLPQVTAQGETIVQVQMVGETAVPIQPMPAAATSVSASSPRPMYGAPVRPGDAGVRVIPNTPAPSAPANREFMGPESFSDFPGSR